MYAAIGYGTPVSGFNAAIQPAIPAFTPGNLLVLQSQSYAGNLATPSLSGWTKVSPGTLANQIACWIRIAQAGDVGPSISWGNQWASAWINVYSGNPSTLTGIVHASNDRVNSSTNTVGYPTLGITQAGCLVILGGYRNKSATSNGGSFNALTGFAKHNQSVISGIAIAAVTNDVIQTTATNIAQLSQVFTTDTNQQYESFAIALMPASSGGGGGGGTTPTPSRLGLMGVG